MSDNKQNTTWVASINKPTNVDIPPCETVLMATNEQFREFAAKVAAAIEAHEAAKTDAVTRPIGSETALDCIWIEAVLIVAAMDKHNENT